MEPLYELKQSFSELEMQAGYLVRVKAKFRDSSYKSGYAIIIQTSDFVGSHFIVDSSIVNVNLDEIKEVEL